MSLRNKIGMKIGICYKVLLGIAVLASAAGLILYTKESIETAGKAAQMCIEVILPSLFPFLVVSNLIIGLGFAESVGRILSPLMRRIFNLNGSCASAFIMGIVGGYPVGARAAISSYERGLCTKTECERMLSFCNNSGPAFILGVVGAGVFANSQAGMLLYLAHVLASITVGICFRFYKRRAPVSRPRPMTYESQKPSKVFVDSVRGGLVGIGNISAFVIFFAVAINLLFASGAIGAIADGIAFLLSPFGVSSGSVEQLLAGGIEITSGLTSLRGAAQTMTARLSMAAFMLGWAGISVHCQVLSFIGDSGLSLLPYLAGKALHAILSAVYIWILSTLFPISINTAAIAAEHMDQLTQINMAGALVYALINCATVVAGLLLLWGWSRLRKSN